MQKKNEGFTAIEIILVVFVIGLLAGLASLWLTKVMENSRDATAETELALISDGVLQMAWDTGKWPSGVSRTEEAGSPEATRISGSSLFSVSTSEDYPDWKGPYYEGAVVDPWGQPYVFVSGYVITGKSHFAVVSTGSDKSSLYSHDSDNIYVLLDD